MSDDDRLRHAGAFIDRIGRKVGRKLRGTKHCGYTVLDSSGVGMGFVRFNARGDFTVYIYSDDRGPDPEGRFKPQPKDAKDRHYVFPGDDSKAQAYAIRALEKIFDLRRELGMT